MIWSGFGLLLEDQVVVVHDVSTASMGQVIPGGV
jgi:hypothetical protein